MKVGDKVTILETNIEEYCRGKYNGKEGKITKIDFCRSSHHYCILPDSWTYKGNGIWCKIKEAQMNMRERIEAITGWGKDTDDILQEITKEMDTSYYLNIRVKNGPPDNTIEIYEGPSRKLVGFSASTQCEKLRAFKDALLWLAEKAGKLDDKKDKAREEIAQLSLDAVNLNNRIKDLERKL